jgi:sigma-B regulation protein RsbU (phosphoserine phosphatase)
MSLPPSPHLDNTPIDLTLIEEISRSILSNLDRDSLLNSSITLLYQLFDFSRVAIYTTRSADRTVLKNNHKSLDGLETESVYHCESDKEPVSWCVVHRELVSISDSSVDNRFPPEAFENNAQSELVLPLLQGDLLVGVLDLCADTKNAFAAETVKAFTLLAGNLAIAIRNASLYRAEQTQRVVAERLQDVIGFISIDVSINDIFDHIFNELGEFFTWEAAAIWLRDSSPEETGIEQFITSYHLADARYKDPANSTSFVHYQQTPAEANKLLSKFPWLTQVFEQKLALVRSKDTEFEPLGGLLGFDSQYSAMAAPLLIHDQVIGVIVCVDHNPDRYDDESIPILQVFANYFTSALENTRLFSAAHDQAWITTVLLQLAEATQSITNLDDLLETVSTILPGLIDANACAVFLWEPSIETFYYKASSGFDAEQSQRLKAWDISLPDVAAFAQLTGTKNPVILNVDNLTADIAGSVFPAYDFDTDLLILFPLMARNILSGVILVDFVDSDLGFSSPQEEWDEKYTLIQGAASQVANAIENLLLIKAQEEEAYISVALLQVAQAVVSLNQLDEILATIVRITPILVGVKRCLVYIWDSKEQLFYQSQNYGFSKNELAVMGQSVKPDEFPLLEAIHKTDRIIYYSLSTNDLPASWNKIASNDCQIIEAIDAQSDNEEISIKLDENSIIGREPWLIGFPMSVKAENLGVILIEEEALPRGSPSLHLREKRIQIVKGITQQAAIAIKNEQLQQEAVRSERMERELQLAREIQATFLPDKIPEIPNWDIDVYWQPAREVGGDFYDILLLDHQKIGFVMADVADKGMPAALFMTLIRTLIRAAAKDKISPAAVLKQVNELLIPDTKHGMFVTLFYGVISVDTGIMSYANAGHNPPLVKRCNSDELTELTRTSMALGIFDDIEVEEREISVEPGDCVFLYTDGITEAFSSDGEMFGIARLKNLIADSEFTDSHGLSSSIIEAVQNFIIGTELSDDMTMGVIFRKPHR